MISFEDPITETQKRFAQGVQIRAWLFILLLVVLLLGTFTLAGILYGAYRYYLTYGITYEDDVKHFKYGSIGSELANGLPYRLFVALPKLFPEEFGKEKDYSHFGFIYEEGKNRKKDLPIGFGQGVRSSIDVAWFNCSVCHTGKVILPGEDKPRIIPGMPANTVELEKFFLALFRMVEDKDFSWESKKFQEAIQSPEAGGKLSWFDKILWQWTVVPNTRNVLLDRRNRLLPLLKPDRDTLERISHVDNFVCRPPKLEKDNPCFRHQGVLNIADNQSYLKKPLTFDKATSWGPGRVDTFNPYKLIQFDIDAFCLPKEERFGVSDFPSIFLQKPRGDQMMNLHWDGNNSSLAERNLSAAIGAGVTEDTVNHDSIQKIAKWLQTLEPNIKNPYVSKLNPEQLKRGKNLYMQNCASCHGYQSNQGYIFKGDRLGQIEHISHIQTDPGRLDSYTTKMEEYQKEQLFCKWRNKKYRFRQFKKTNGYANQPLDYLWLRAPYLHNGSVPTLKDLLEKPDNRPSTFVRGNLKLDISKGGFEAPECSSSDKNSKNFCFDTSLQGNLKDGHLYGTNLSKNEKQDLLTYLLSF